MRMHNPPHPGEIIKRLCLEPLGVSVSEAAQSLRLMKGKVNKLFWIFGFCLIASSCAGPNPNPGERTTDMFWTSGKFERAFERATPHAEAGEPWAQLRLGIFYENGWGTSVDVKKAEYWYKKVIDQKSTGDWAEGQMIGAVGKPGYFNQNSDARIAQFNLAQLYYKSGNNLDEAHRLISNLIEETNGKAVFFCCEFADSRYFTQKQFTELKDNIEKGLKDKPK
jgi:hypothetical protein